ncbi:MAG: hypothetical protein K2I69_01465 [Muribaculaceae bacterium]|nr:hypothetical protein [Muribaculaceae bacterium]
MRRFKITVAVLAAFAGGYATAIFTRSPRVTTCIVTTRDTVTVVRPVVHYVRDTVERPVRRLALASADSTCASLPDSVCVVVPRSETVYEGNDYRAVVSGFEARLDSISIYRTHTVNYTTVPAAGNGKRWSVGVQGGVGLTPRGVQPYIGIGVSFRIL